MPLVSAKCTNCGANLEVDNTKDAAICQYCGTPYIVEKAINNFNTTNNIKADVVNIYGGNSADFVIRAGELVKYNGASTEVEIPNSVTIIGNNAFIGCKGLVSITIPDSVTSIGSFAFSHCSGLKSIDIPNSVNSIGNYAFYDCSSLTGIVIPEGVTSIGSSTFSGCTSLNSIVIPNSVTSIDSSAFYDCSNLKSITIPHGVTKIYNSVFSRCSSLKSITIPDSVTYIGEDAFYSCGSLQSITIPDSVTTIYHGAFDKCDNLTINASEKWKSENWRLHPSLEEYRSQPRSGGCYIATAVYGSYDCPPVWTLRRYRDNKLSKSIFGRAFIRCYYATSPTVIRLFGKQKWFNRFWKKTLDKFVKKLQNDGYESSPYTDR